jgi:membrane-bound lytic murein transglycosylase D
MVKEGDNLFSIARQHNTSVDRILGINKLPKNTKIYPGQKLNVE